MVLVGGYFIFFESHGYNSWELPWYCPFMFLITGTGGFTGGYFNTLRTVATAPKSCLDMCVPVSNIWKTGVDTCKHSLLTFCVYYLPTDNLVALQYALLNIVNTPWLARELEWNTPMENCFLSNYHPSLLVCWRLMVHSGQDNGMIKHVIYHVMTIYINLVT